MTRRTSRKSSRASLRRNAIEFSPELRALAQKVYGTAPAPAPRAWAPMKANRRTSCRLRRNNDPGTFNTALAKLIPRLKKDLGAVTIRQGYKGTGAKSHRRQIFVRFANDQSIDIWLDAHVVRLGGVMYSGFGHISNVDKTPTEVYAELVTKLRPIAAR